MGLVERGFHLRGLPVICSVLAKIRNYHRSIKRWVAVGFGRCLGINQEVAVLFVPGLLAI